MQGDNSKKTNSTPTIAAPAMSYHGRKLTRPVALASHKGVSPVQCSGVLH